jgi:hypothetical protein
MVTMFDAETKRIKGQKQNHPSLLRQHIKGSLRKKDYETQQQRN